MFDDFDDVDFSGVKVLTPPPPGEYHMVITDWDIQPTKSAESNAKGKNIFVTFKMVDPVGPNGEDWSEFKTRTKPIYTMPANPFAIVPLVAAIRGYSMSEENLGEKLGRMPLGDKSEWIGSEVMVRIIHNESPTNGKVYANPVEDGFSPVGF